MHRAKFETCARNEDIDKLFKKFNDYTQLYVIRDIQDSLENFVKNEEFSIMEDNLSRMKKNILLMCTKEEFLARLTVLNSEINTKLIDRPTNQYFRKVLTSYDEKIS